MKNKIVIFTFDIRYPGEPSVPYASACIHATLKNNKEISENFDVSQLSFNLHGRGPLKNFEIEELFCEITLSAGDYIALGCYFWSDHIIKDLIAYIRSNYPGVCIILGGYQINNALPDILYPGADFYIQGYAEAGVIDVICGKSHTKKSKIIQKKIDFSDIPSPYLTGIIDLEYGQNEVLMETSRGCAYRCTFCAHTDVLTGNVYNQESSKVEQELALFKEKNVKQINVLDPIFNIGPTYIPTIKAINNIGINSFFTFQARFEPLDTKKGSEFLEMASTMNCRLEFGLQTANEWESLLIARQNKMERVISAINKLNENNFDYEISLIYGLPGQTLDSFKDSVSFACDSGAQRVVAFPLMLLPGTKLYNDRHEYNFTEVRWGEYDLPVVNSSNTFSRNDWEEMNNIASNLLTSDKRL